MSVIARACFCFLRITKITIPIKINNNPAPVPTKTYIKEFEKKRAILCSFSDNTFKSIPKIYHRLNVTELKLKVWRHAKSVIMSWLKASSKFF